MFILKFILHMSFFRKSNEQKSDFKFRESENTACFVCGHVMDKSRPILLASHEKEDGCWQFLCGFNNHNDADIKIISLKQAVEIDSSINELFEMSLGLAADRKSVNHKWEPFASTGQ
jgi:hypothetical protein